MDEGIKQELIKIVGEENYTERLIDMVSYSYDASEHSHRPSCGVWPGTAEQVSEILKLANSKAGSGHPSWSRDRSLRHGRSQPREESSSISTT